MKSSVQGKRTVGSGLLLVAVLSGCASEVGGSVPERVEAVSQDAFESGSAGAAALDFDGADELVDKNAGRATKIYIKTGDGTNHDTRAKAKLRYCQKIDKANCGWKDTVTARLWPVDEHFDLGDTDFFPNAYVDPAWTVTWVELSHDNSGHAPAWYVEYVDLHVPRDYPENGQLYWWYVYRCTFSRWLSSDPDIGLKTTKSCVQRTGYWDR